MQERAAQFAAQVQEALEVAFGAGSARVSLVEGEALAFEAELGLNFALTFGLDPERLHDPESVVAAGAVMTALAVGKNIAEPLRELSDQLLEATPEAFVSEAADELISTLVESGLIEGVTDAEEVPEEAGDD